MSTIVPAIPANKAYCSSVASVGLDEIIYVDSLGNHMPQGATLATALPACSHILRVYSHFNKFSHLHRSTTVSGPSLNSFLPGDHDPPVTSWVQAGWRPQGLPDPPSNSFFTLQIQ